MDQSMTEELFLLTEINIDFSCYNCLVLLPLFSTTY